MSRYIKCDVSIHGILLSLKKEAILTHATTRMNHEGTTSSKISRPEKEVYNSTSVRYIETDSRKVGTRGRERRSGDLAFNGDRVSVGVDRKVLEMDGGDGCPT